MLAAMSDAFEELGARLESEGPSRVVRETVAYVLLEADAVGARLDADFGELGATLTGPGRQDSAVLLAAGEDNADAILFAFVDARGATLAEATFTSVAARAVAAAVSTQYLTLTRFLAP